MFISCFLIITAIRHLEKSTTELIFHCNMFLVLTSVYLTHNQIKCWFPDFSIVLIFLIVVKIYSRYFETVDPLPPLRFVSTNFIPINGFSSGIFITKYSKVDFVVPHCTVTMAFLCKEVLTFLFLFHFYQYEYLFYRSSSTVIIICFVQVVPALTIETFSRLATFFFDFRLVHSINHCTFKSLM